MSGQFDQILANTSVPGNFRGSLIDVMDTYHMINAWSQDHGEDLHESFDINKAVEMVMRRVEE